MKKSTQLFGALIISAISVSPALAGGVNIKGNADLNTKVKTAVNVAVDKSKAQLDIGGVRGNVTIKGNLKQNTQVKTAVNVAVKGSKACMNIGGIAGGDQAGKC